MEIGEAWFPAYDKGVRLTEAQQLLLDAYIDAGWTYSHIAEYRVGRIGPWLIQKHKVSEASAHEYVHAFISAEGIVVRVPPVRQKRIKRDDNG